MRNSTPSPVSLAATSVAFQSWQASVKSGSSSPCPASACHRIDRHSWAQHQLRAGKERHRAVLAGRLQLAGLHTHGGGELRSRE